MKNKLGFAGRLMIGVVLGVGLVSTLEGYNARLINEKNEENKVSSQQKYIEKLAKSLESLVYVESSVDSTINADRIHKYYYTNIYNLRGDVASAEFGTSGDKKSIITIDSDNYKKNYSLDINSSNILDKDLSGLNSQFYDESSVRSNQKLESWSRLKQQAELMYSDSKKNNYKWPCDYKSHVKDVWGRDFNYTRVSPVDAKISFNLPWDNTKIMSMDLTLPDRERLIVQNGMKSYQNVKDTGFATFASYMIKYDGTLWVSGDNSTGQLGLGDTTIRKSFVEVPGLKNVKQIYTDYYLGSKFAMALTESGELYGVGYNADGHLGTGNTTWQSTWVKVLDNVKDVYFSDATSGGLLATYAIKNDGTLWVVGDNAYGQLGVGDKVQRTSFVQAPGVSNVKKIYTSLKGQRFAFLLTEEGKLYATGGYVTGQLGTGTTSALTTWTQALTDVKDLHFVFSSGINVFSTYAIKNDGTLWVTGDNTYGQLGLGDRTIRNTFVQVPGIAGAKRIYTDDYLGCRSVMVLTELGDLYSAGYNGYGHLANGSTADQLTWLKVLDSVKDIYYSKSTNTGYIATYAVKEDGVLWVTGDNEHGQLGLGDLVRRTSFVQVPNISNVKKVYTNKESGVRFAMVLTRSGDLYSAGYGGYGHLGTGTTTDQKTWLKVLDNVRDVAYSMGVNRGDLATYAVKYDDTLWVTGDNIHGQLGIGSTTKKTSFVDTGLINVERIFTSYPGPKCAFALKNDKSVYAAGTGIEGHLGVGILTDQTTWKKVLDSNYEMIDECN